VQLKVGITAAHGEDGADEQLERLEAVHGGAFWRLRGRRRLSRLRWRLNLSSKVHGHRRVDIKTRVAQQALQVNGIAAAAEEAVS